MSFVKKTIIFDPLVFPYGILSFFFRENINPSILDTAVRLASPIEFKVIIPNPGKNYITLVHDNFNKNMKTYFDSKCQYAALERIKSSLMVDLIKTQGKMLSGCSSVYLAKLLRLRDSAVIDSQNNNIVSADRVRRIVAAITRALSECIDIDDNTSFNDLEILFYRANISPSTKLYTIYRQQLDSLVYAVRLTMGEEIYKSQVAMFKLKLMDLMLDRSLKESFPTMHKSEYEKAKNQQKLRAPVAEYENQLFALYNKKLLPHSVMIEMKKFKINSDMESDSIKWKEKNNGYSQKRIITSETFDLIDEHHNLVRSFTINIDKNWDIFNTGLLSSDKESKHVINDKFAPEMEKINVKYDRINDAQPKHEQVIPLPNVLSLVYNKPFTIDGITYNTPLEYGYKKLLSLFTNVTTNAVDATILENIVTKTSVMFFKKSIREALYKLLIAKFSNPTIWLLLHTTNDSDVVYDSSDVIFNKGWGSQTLTWFRDNSQDVVYTPSHKVLNQHVGMNDLTINIFTNEWFRWRIATWINIANYHPVLFRKLNHSYYNNEDIVLRFPTSDEKKLLGGCNSDVWKVIILEYTTKYSMLTLQELVVNIVSDVTTTKERNPDIKMCLEQFTQLYYKYPALFTSSTQMMVALTGSTDGKISHNQVITWLNLIENCGILK